MSDIAIRVDHLSKRYTIGALQSRWPTPETTGRTELRATLHDTTSARLSAGLRDALVATLQRPARSLSKGSHVRTLERSDELRALRDVSLLKILPRITQTIDGIAICAGCRFAVCLVIMRSGTCLMKEARE